jgi:hypothetical protein
MDIESVVQHNTDMVQNAFMQVPIQVQVQYNNITQHLVQLHVQLTIVAYNII